MTVTLRIFTHPACPTCGPVVKAAWDLRETENVPFELQTVSLAEKSGLAEAHKNHITTIPTAIVFVQDKEVNRIVGTPNREQLRIAIEQANTAGS